MRRSRRYRGYFESYLERDRHFTPSCDLPECDAEIPVPSVVPGTFEFNRELELLLRRLDHGLMPSIHLAPDYPHRPVDWRWQLACRAQLGEVQAYTDEWIERAQQYVKHLRQRHADDEYEKLDDVDSALFHANNIYRTGNKLVRGRLDAYLLGRLSNDEIAAKCTCDAVTVEAYEALYFNVRDRLKHPLLIRNIAFNGWELDGSMRISDGDIDLLLKRAGFEQGGAVLEPMLRYFESDWRALDQESLPSRSDLVDLRQRVSVRKLILAWLAPPELERARLLHELGRELERMLVQWPEHTDVPSGSPFPGLQVTSAQRQAWWNSWRTVVALNR